MTALVDAAWPWPLLAALLVAAPALWHALRVRRLRTVFLSYRRSDSADPTAALALELRSSFGRRVFHDIVSLRPGEDFRSAIARTLWRCDAALVIIGPDWAAVSDAGGQPRLFAADDVVRAEVAGALDSGALVVPVLVGGAAMPRPEELPPDLQGLRALNALRLPDGDARTALDALNAAIRAAPLRQTPGFLAACHAAVLAQLTVFGLLADLDTGERLAQLGIAAPGLSAVLAAAALQAWRPAGPSRVPAPSPRVAPASLVLPLAFVAAISLLVVLRALNHLGAVPFLAWLAAAMIGFAAYSGAVLASLRENRRAR